MADTTSPRTSRLALASLFLGILGVPALVFGFLGLRAVNASDGQLKGRRLALAGMALGGIVSFLSLLGCLAVVLLHVREKSNRAECANNNRQTGQAMNISFNQHNKQFPPGTVPNPALPPEKRFGWPAGLLPYLGQKKDGTGPWQSLAGKLDFDQAWDAPPNQPAVTTLVSRYLCPGHPAYDPEAMRGQTHYVGIGGLGLDAPTVPKENKRAGFFGYDRMIGVIDLEGGTTYTLASLETTQRNGPWAAGGDPTVRGLDTEAPAYVGPGRQFGGCHRGGANALYADGSCRWISEAIDNRTFEQTVPLARELP
jgi:prepilin-type processing-associated H-X9-DG protein